MFVLCVFPLCSSVPFVVRILFFYAYSKIFLCVLCG
jgi:hypothetical protein